MILNRRTPPLYLRFVYMYGCNAGGMEDTNNWCWKVGCLDNTVSVWCKHNARTHAHTHTHTHTHAHTHTRCARGSHVMPPCVATLCNNTVISCSWLWAGVHVTNTCPKTVGVAWLPSNPPPPRYEIKALTKMVTIFLKLSTLYYISNCSDMVAIFIFSVGVSLATKPRPRCYVTCTLPQSCQHVCVCVFHPLTVVS